MLQQMREVSTIKRDTDGALFPDTVDHTGSFL